METDRKRNWELLTFKANLLSIRFEELAISLRELLYLASIHLDEDGERIEEWLLEGNQLVRRHVNRVKKLGEEDHG